MTREEAEYFLRGISYKLGNIAVEYLSEKDGEKMREAIKALKQESTIENVGVDWESYKDANGNSLDCLILNVLQNNFDCGDAYGYTIADKIIGLLPSVTPQEPFINKPCVSSEVCEHDKQKVLDKIRAEVESIENHATNNGYDFWLRTPEEIKKDVFNIIDKYKAEQEEA